MKIICKDFEAEYIRNVEKYEDDYNLYYGDYWSFNVECEVTEELGLSIYPLRIIADTIVSG